MASSGWAVTGQVTDQVEVTDAGQVVPGVNVYFVTGNGNKGVVFVPQAHYHNTKTVHAMIKAEAGQIDKIGELAEGMAGN